MLTVSEWDDGYYGKMGHVAMAICEYIRNSTPYRLYAGMCGPSFLSKGIDVPFCEINLT